MTPPISSPAVIHGRERPDADPSRVRIAGDLIDGLLAEAARTPDVETCGLLFGDRAAIAAALPTRNVAADPTRWFEIDPAALIAALKAERAGGARIVGHYHSHPGGSALPSPRDQAAAEPGRLWLILGGGVARLWLARADGFAALEITPA